MFAIGIYKYQFKPKKSATESNKYPDAKIFSSASKCEPADKNGRVEQAARYTLRLPCICNASILDLNKAKTLEEFVGFKSS